MTPDHVRQFNALFEAMKYESAFTEATKAFDDRVQLRLEQLVRFIAMRAPDCMIEMQCRNIVNAYHDATNGRISDPE